jgi:DNA polymerase III epsilon subunit-like protein
MYAAVKRQRLDRASKRDIAYCTTWLRENEWRRVQKRLPDGQRVMVWKAPDGISSRPSRHTLASEPRPSSAEAATAVENDCDGSLDDVAGVAGQGTPKAHPNTPRSHPLFQPEFTCSQSLTTRHTQHAFSVEHVESDFSSSSEGVRENFTFKMLKGQSALGVPALDALLPTTLDVLEEVFPRDRFLALDVETTGLSAACDGLRTVQLADGESVAIVIFNRPVPAHALVVLADFLHGRRVVVHNARFEASWLQLAGIDLVLDDTLLLFSAVRGTRLPKGDKQSGGGSGRVSLAALAAMVLGETLDKSEQTSDWAVPELSEAQLTYALNDAIVTHRVWEALRAELHHKRKQYGVDIVAGYEDARLRRHGAHHGACWYWL